ncbi:MAG: metallophosphoesterase [Bacteroidetes bacterium]|nr:metallophosphoesterase [Bacteroidota bacterium]
MNSRPTISRRRFMASLAVGSLAAYGADAAAGAVLFAPAGAQPLAWREGLAPKRVAIVGDVQRTGMLEMLLLGRHQNDAERVAVLRAIAEEGPEMLLMLGDQVVTGDGRAWEYFDSIMTPVRRAGIPVHGMLGNHDYEGEKTPACIENFSQRFPHQRDRVHGLTRLGPVALLTVDSNFPSLSDRQVQEQVRRYAQTLAELDAAPDVRCVIVASHHPPYTNSSLHSGTDLKQVEEMFAAPFLRARKTRLYLSGHVHSYERFVAEGSGKTFVVSGGGGGPRRTVDITEHRPYRNDAYREGTLRPFHFMVMTVHDDRLAFEVRMLVQRGAWRFRTGDIFDVRFT